MSKIPCLSVIVENAFKSGEFSQLARSYFIVCFQRGYRAIYKNLKLGLFDLTGVGLSGTRYEKAPTGLAVRALNFLATS